MYHHLARPLKKGPNDSRAACIERNRAAKKALVERGSSHGILVFAETEPIGWCQFGLSHELPRVDNDPKYRKIAPDPGGKPLWRIPCFVVPSRYRRCGVASTALKAALAAIQRRGGGLVEAYPIRQWGAYTNYRGTVLMFEREGFRAVAPFGASNVLMRRSL